IGLAQGVHVNLMFLLILSLGCVDGLRFETKTIGVGDALTLTCPRQKSDGNTYLFWTRFISGSLPEVLGGTFSFDYDSVNSNRHFTTKQEPESFVLQIHQTQLSDTGFYYCMKVNIRKMTFIEGIFLTFEDHNITAVLQVPPSESARSVTIQCSVPSHSESRTCPGEHSVYWFKVGPKESHPRLVYTHGNSEDECERSPEGPASEECVYSLSKIIHSADAGTYSCAVVTCGEMSFGNVTRLEQQDLNSGFRYVSHLIK
uniref:Ig-like domain-containing protein n=1 Tax=Mola mola TaxID=94237 RepID=A0A3Q4AM55_MOLML